jgi:hypothetical protein
MPFIPIPTRAVFWEIPLSLPYLVEAHLLEYVSETNWYRLKASESRT